MKGLDLNEFRQIFYFFQYQFYLRSERGIRKGMHAMLPCGSIGRFLFELAEDHEDAHYRWEPIDLRPRIVGRTRGATGLSIRAQKKLAKQLSEDPSAPLPTRPCVICRAKRKSIRCRFMLFDFPKKYRNDQIVSLYKSLIVHDLVRSYEFSRWEVAKTAINKKVSSLGKFRSTTYWERISGNIFEKLEFLQEEIFSDPLVSVQLSTFEDYLESKRFTFIEKTSTKKIEKNVQDSAAFDHLRNLHGEIKRYYDRALKLAALAPTGHFKNFPTFLP